jgi:hypothetical protein
LRALKCECPPSGASGKAHRSRNSQTGWWRSASTLVKIRQILAARAVRQIEPPVQVAEFRLDTIKKIQERYSFLKIPTTYDEMFGTDPEQGVQFHHGKFVTGNKTIIVDLLQFLPNMVVADTRSSTDDSDLFLDDYIANANSRQADTITVTGPTIYVSQIEFTTDVSLDKYVPLAPTITSAIDRLLAHYKIQMPPYRVMGVMFHSDLTRVAGLPPGHFTIERRKDFPYESNTYYSHAPLKTRDHFELLETLDRTVTQSR